jgi:PRTRC genetic system ThiF family protein
MRLGRVVGNKYVLGQRALEERIEVVVVGAGGSGSHMVANLAVLHQSLVDLGHPYGLRVTLCDDDEVSHANVGRARFFASDVGASKASTLVTRVNVAYGLDWDAVPARVEEGRRMACLDRADLVIGCVDSRAARRAIHSALLAATRFIGPKAWLDLGNGASDGQVVLGEVGQVEGLRLPTVLDLYPELGDPNQDPRDPGPSCSRAEALSLQGPLVNAQAALQASAMLFELLRYGSLPYCALWFDQRQAQVSTLRVDPQTWARMGFVASATVGVDSEAESEAA